MMAMGAEGMRTRVGKQSREWRCSFCARRCFVFLINIVVFLLLLWSRGSISMLVREAYPRDVLTVKHEREKSCYERLGEANLG